MLFIIEEEEKKEGTHNEKKNNLKKWRVSLYTLLVCCIAVKCGVSVDLFALQVSLDCDYYFVIIFQGTNTSSTSKSVGFSSSYGLVTESIIRASLSAVEDLIVECGGNIGDGLALESKHLNSENSFSDANTTQVGYL